MKLKAALEYEKLRDQESANKIILHQDGKFYHAYEWSAWLIKCTENNDENGGLKVSLYQTTNAEYVISGFPLESLSKYISDYVGEPRPIDEKTLELTVETEYADFDSMKEDFDIWRQELPVHESKKLQSKAQVASNRQNVGPRHSGMFSILAQVMSYPVERSTPAENMEFISRLKQELADLL